MIRKSLVLLALIFMVLVLFSAQSTPAYACTPTPQGRPPYTLEDKVKAAPIILEGRVISVIKDASPTGEKAMVEVSGYYKGTGPATITIENFGSSAQCLTTVRTGERLIFYVSVDQAGNYRAFYMSAGAAISSATPENITLLTAITGAPKPPQSAPVAVGATTSLIFIIVGIVVFLIFVMA